MPRRALSLAILLLLLGALPIAPATAKTGDIDHLVIAGPDGPLEILGAMLNGQLSPAEQRALYRPLLMGKNKSNVAPGGHLGPRYDTTYVFRDVHDDPVSVHEIVYLDAEPPVAFAPRGQTYELYTGDAREVPWGWRSFPHAAVPAIFSLMEDAARERPPGGTAEWVLVPPWMAIMALLVVAAIIWLCAKLIRRWLNRRDVPA